MYIAEAVKERLRDHAGESIQIKATRVRQPRNPGDGLILDFDSLSAAPATRIAWASGDGLRLHAAPAFEDGETPIVIVTIENVSLRERHIRSSEMGPTLLTRKESNLIGLIPAYGPSFAVITCNAFYVDGPRTRGGGSAGGRACTWRIDEPLPETFVLGPGEERQFRVNFDLPEGEYDFLTGDGGGVHEGLGIASDLVAFDVGAGGKATRVKVKDR